MPKKLPALSIDVTTYPALLRCLRKIVSDGQRLIEITDLRTRWETGYYITKHILQNKRAEYGKEVLPKLAEDMEVSRALLDRCVQFVEKYPDPSICATSRKLAWSHFQELFAIPDDREREKVQKAIVQKGLTIDQVRALKNANKNAKPLPPLARPDPTGLKLDTFRLAKPEVAALWTVAKGEVLVDRGFFSYHPVPRSEVEALLTETPSWTYRALLERVVDGDTVVALIDTRFGGPVEERLRLRGINCPELGTPEGETAKKFVEKELPVGTTIVIKSKKDTDPHGRFVVDLLYGGDTPDAIISEGEYLNQVLLDKKLAVRMAE